MRNTRTALIGVGIATAGLAAFGASWLVGRHPIGNPRVPEPAKPVDLERYLGRWYEIARYDQRIERGCEAATADYSLRSDGKIDVLNRCRKRGDDIKEALGVAKVVDTQTNAKLKVSFFGPFYGNYWILDHADDYSWSIVGEPSGRYLWLLDREPRPSDGDKQKLISRISAMGYDPSMLVFDSH